MGGCWGFGGVRVGDRRVVVGGLGESWVWGGGGGVREELGWEGWG